MVHRFPTFEIDEDQREIRAGGRVLSLQPRVFDLLAYLARNKARVVPKDELLDAVWPDVTVADGSLQRAVSLARSALGEAGVEDAIRTFSRQGYRLVVDAAASSPGPEVAAPAAPPAPRPLLTKIRDLLNKSGLARPDLELADEYCRLATQLDRSDAEAWAAWSQVDTWYVYHNFDPSPARRESARTKAARALQMAPGSFEARLAHACYLVRCGRYFRVSVGGEEAERHLRDLLEERPGEPRTIFALAILVRNCGRHDEALTLLDQLTAVPEFAANAWTEKGWLLFGFMGRCAEATAAAGAAVALEPGWINLGLQLHLAQIWEGDLDRARAVLDRLPAAILLEDFSIQMACELFRWRREPAEMLRVLEAAPRDWLTSNGFTGPKRLVAGDAHALAGRHGAAALEWRAAIATLDHHIEQMPHDPDLHYRKGTVLARLGERDAAAAAFELYRAYRGGDNSYGKEVPVSIWLGDLEQAVLDLEQWLESGFAFLTAANLRLNPDYDPLRGHPRFEKLLARLERDVQFSPAAKRRRSSNE